MRKSSTGEWCAYCEREAWYRMDVQWSIVDFLSVMLCNDCLHDAYEHYNETTVDGNYPSDIHTVWLEILPF